MNDYEIFQRKSNEWVVMRSRSANGWRAHSPLHKLFLLFLEQKFLFRQGLNLNAHHIFRMPFVQFVLFMSRLCITKSPSFRWSVYRIPFHLKRTHTHHTPAATNQHLQWQNNSILMAQNVKSSLRFFFFLLFAQLSWVNSAINCKALNLITQLHEGCVDVE